MDITTAIAAGGCPACGFMIAFPAQEHPADRTACPACAATITLTWTVGKHNERMPCDDRCQYASRNLCSCSCGGVNHRAGYIRVDMVPTWVRERDAKRIADKKARVEAREQSKRQAAEQRKQDLIEEHPDLAVLLTDRYAHKFGFVADMRAAVRKGEMTPRQIAAAVDMVRRDRERDAREQQRQQERERALAAGAQCPIGKVQITGTIVSIRYQEAYHPAGRGCEKMLIDSGQGWRVWTTVPRALQDATLPDSRGVDTHEKWRKNLAGQQVTLKGTCEPGKDGDPLFGILKRPVLISGPTPATA